ncbi:MAG: hypothetical protein ACI4KM_00250 [Oscillospiraceae bacterium]
MGEISAQIDSIIAARKAKVSVLKKQKDDIKKIGDSIGRFEKLQRDISEHPERYSVLQGNSDVLGRITNISTNRFYDLFSKYNRELDRITARVQRDSLNISFVGCMGQGKSLVMQSISGLGSNVIPSAEGTSCTGAKSVIVNTDSNTVTAKISFFSQVEIVGIVNKYLEYITRFEPEKVSVSSVEEIKALSSKKEYLNNCASNQFEAASKLEQLTKYIDHYDSYYSYLGTEINVPENEIEKYVAQYSSNDWSQQYYLYLGVKSASIMCHFPHEDVGKIVLVDTVGLGDTALGVEEDMLNAVANDSDAIIYLIKPDVQRPDVDSKTVEVWGKIQKRISAEYMKEMLFVLLNKVNTNKFNNTGAIDRMRMRIDGKGYSFAKVLAADCSKPNEVRSELLGPVLKQLANRIQIVDQRLIDKLNELGDELRQAYNEICIQTEKAFVKSANEDMKRHFHTTIQSTYDHMLDKLRELYIHKYNDLRSQPCTELEKECHQKLKNILTSVPNVNEIKDLLNMGSMKPLDVYDTGTNILRMKIINDFTNLNTVLSEIIERMKLEILDVFFNNGLLNRIASFDKGYSSSDWIKSFLIKTDSDSKYPLIYEALKSFDNYTINVQGFIIHEVRDRLDSIDLMIYKKYPHFIFGIDQKDKLANEIVEELKGKAFDIKSKLTGALTDLYKIPNKSMFAAITDLCDRLSFSKKGNDSVTLEWRYLYEDWMRQIWTEEYDKQSGLRQVIGEWNDIITSLKEMNKPECFNI